MALLDSMVGGLTGLTGLGRQAAATIPRNTVASVARPVAQQVITLPNGQTVTVGPDGGILGGQPSPGQNVGPVTAPGVPSVLPPAGSPGGPPAATDPGLTGAAWYQQMLANDPQLQAILAGISAQQQAYQGQMTAAQQQALEQYGEIPAGLLNGTPYAGLFTPTVQGIADANTAGGVSTVAQLQKALADANLSSSDSLAARGLLHSGAFGQHANTNLQGYNVANYNALQTLLGGLGTDYSNYLGQQDTLNQQSSTATSDALTRILNQIAAGTLTAPGGDSGTKTAAPGSQTQTTDPKTTPPPAAPTLPTVGTPPTAFTHSGGGAPPAMSVPYNPKPPTSPVVGSLAGGYALAPGVAGRAGVGTGGALG